MKKFTKSPDLKKSPVDVYDIITDRILSEMENSGKLVWVKPWKSAHGNFPMNGKTKRRYEGVNLFLLQFSGFSSPYWLSYKQVTEMGGTVKKGEKATQVVFWKMNVYSDTNPDTGEEKTKKVPMLRYYNVFNADQCEGLNIKGSEPVVYNDNEQIEQAEAIIKKYKFDNPELILQVKESAQAFYSPSQDLVNMPLLNQFNGNSEFYSTYFHEMGHSTGHQKRLNRKEITSANSYFGSCDYGAEELCAELTAAFLCAETGISNDTLTRNSTAYIKNWMKHIKADKKLFIMAAARANKAAKFILNIVTPEQGEED